MVALPPPAVDIGVEPSICEKCIAVINTNTGWLLQRIL